MRITIILLFCWGCLGTLNAQNYCITSKLNLQKKQTSYAGIIAKGQRDTIRAKTSGTVSKTYALNKQVIPQNSPICTIKTESLIDTYTAKYYGVVDTLLVAGGDKIARGQILYIYRTRAAMEIKAKIPMTLYNDFQIHQVFRVELSNSPRILTAHVYRLGDDEKGVGTYFTLRARIKENISNEFVGSKARIIKTSANQQVIIPIESICHDKDGAYVYIVSDADKLRAVQKRISIGEITLAGVICRSGLTGNEELIIDGQKNLSEGCEIVRGNK